eukprot:94640-Chlamydomonas_euryale.AAC.1
MTCKCRKQFTQPSFPSRPFPSSHRPITPSPGRHLQQVAGGAAAHDIQRPQPVHQLVHVRDIAVLHLRGRVLDGAAQQGSVHVPDHDYCAAAANLLDPLLDGRGAYLFQGAARR